MIEITIGKNEEQQRLDKFLRKYLPRAPLSRIYKLVRKDLKVNGKRVKNDYILRDGDRLAIYMTDDEFAGAVRKPKSVRVKRTFRLIYEDADILIVSKPSGLLTHGDRREKKQHLTNQVIDYLTEKGDYVPRLEKTFSPAPVNRLDRNTSGLVIFAKNYPALQAFTKIIRERGSVHKIYLTAVRGALTEDLRLEDVMVRNGRKNRTIITSPADRAAEEPAGKTMLTCVHPMLTAPGAGPLRELGPYTLCGVEIETGRTHQIRSQLAAAGFPIVGDPKYGDPDLNAAARKQAGIRSQVLHAAELRFEDTVPEPYERLRGAVFTALPGKELKRSLAALFGDAETDRIESRLAALRKPPAE